MEEVIRVSLFQAIMLGMLYWINTLSFFYGSNDLYVQPLGIAFWVGLIMGDVKTAMIVGATVAPLYLAFTGGGGTVASDRNAATMIPAVVVIISGNGVDSDAFKTASALAIAIGLLCAQLHTIRRIVAATWVQMADRYAENLNIRGIYLAGTLYCNLVKIVIFWIPMVIMLYLGTGFMSDATKLMPVWLTRGFDVVGKMLPALGMGMTINVIGRTDLIPYYIAGFFMVKYTGVAAMPGAMIALFLAYIHLNIIAQKESDEENIIAQAAAAEVDESQRIFTRKDVNNLFLRWWTWCETSNSFQRLQSLSFCIAFIPHLKKLYGHDDDEMREALKRHLLFFNTQGIWGSVIHGIVLSMEEQRAMGVPIGVDAITGVKTGLMGPFAGIGDTIDWATIRPLAHAFFIPVGLQGSAIAAFGPWIIVTAITQVEGYFFTNLGYKLGTSAALSILESGTVQRVITFLSVMGLFMMGVLTATMVDLQLLPAIYAGGADAKPFFLQLDVLDKVIPGLLALGLVFAVYWYLSKGGGNMMKATFWILGVGLLGGCLGLFGFPKRPVESVEFLNMVRF